MSMGMEEFQYLLLGMRNAFLDDLQERCDECDNLILALEKNPADRTSFDRLYRIVHSMKGSGGTHGLQVITHICHQLESCLASLMGNEFGQHYLELALKHVDLLRQVERPGRTENPDFSAIESALENLRQSMLQNRKSCLVVELSSMLLQVYRSVLGKHSIRMTAAGNGLEALSLLLQEPYDLAIISPELPGLNGMAMLAALRLSHCKNENLPVILVTSNQDALPKLAGVNMILPKDSRLAASLNESLLKLGL